MEDIKNFLKEDLGEEGDITSNALFTSEKAEAYIVAKESCIIAGLEEAKAVFEFLGAEVSLLCKDGDKVKKNQKVMYISGKAKNILAGERLALNFICRMSGIATETKNLVEICKNINPRVTIAATRKTTPGFRKYEKKAVVIGGGEPHRFGLYDAVMIKDNHIKIVGSVDEAIKRVKDKVKDKIIEIEVENEEDALTAAKMNVDIIMLDNMPPEKAKKISEKIREINKDILIEISGGITPDNIKKYAKFADRISLGYLTHSTRSKNFSLEVI
ncbi:MAG: carboxylating nicotinate-nucleotide diphosphorylase [Thermoplasmata archaeon]|nr:carboxylating nicotinate-nucleotide diphosphorylase [Thermoplasmata archaeon]